MAGFAGHLARLLVDTSRSLRYDRLMAVRYTERSKPTKGGLLRNLLGLVSDLAVSAGQNVSASAQAATAGKVVHKPCGTCTAPPAAPPASAP